LVDYIDWTPFFHAWGLRSRFPEVLDHADYAEAARPLWVDAQAMLRKIVDDDWLRPRAAVGFWRAERSPDGDDIVLPDEGVTLHGLRQQLAHRDGKPNLSISDFVAPAGSAVGDHIGGFVVTAGPEEIERAAAFEAAGDDYSSILLK